MEDGGGGEGTRQEVDGGGGSAWVETLETFQGHLLVGVEAGDLGGGEEECGEAAVEPGGAVEHLHPQGCRRVAPVTASHAAVYGAVQGPAVCGEPGEEGGHVGAAGAPHNSNMLSLGGEGEGSSRHHDWRGLLPVGDGGAVALRGGVDQQLGLLRDVGEGGGGGEGLGEVEEGLEGSRMRTHQGHVICLADGGHADSTHVKAEAGVVTHVELLAVNQLELVARGHPTLLNTSRVMDGAHDDLALLDIGGYFWLCLATFGYFWLLLATIGYFGMLLVSYGNCLLHFATFGYLGYYWLLLATFGYIWLLFCYFFLFFFLFFATFGYF